MTKASNIAGTVAKSVIDGMAASGTMPGKGTAAKAAAGAAAKAGLGSIIGGIGAKAFGTVGLLVLLFLPAIAQAAMTLLGIGLAGGLVVFVAKRRGYAIPMPSFAMAKQPSEGEDPEIDPVEARREAARRAA